MMRYATLFGTAALFMALSSTSLVAVGEATAADAGKGMAIYMGHCASCHGMTGDGAGPEGAGLSPAPTNFTNASAMGAISDNDLQQAILRGRPSAGMKGYGTILNPAELDDVIAYIRSLAR